jgi:hypothetical protein
LRERWIPGFLKELWLPSPKKKPDEEDCFSNG